MTVEQYSAFVDAMPQIEEVLKKKGEDIPRQKYSGSNGDAPDGDPAEPESQQDEVEPEDVTVKARNGKRMKANIEATSDEDEDEGD